MKREMLRRKYSNKTIISYCYWINKFLKFCQKEPKKFTKKDVKDYLNLLVEGNKSGSTININLQALKFMMECILNKRKYFYNIKYSRVPRKLPTVLEKQEIIALINSITNPKHKLMIKLIYSAGLRVSELLNLRVCDLNLMNNFGYVRHGKGNKDRMFIIAGSLKQELFNYMINNNLNEDSLLFKSYNGKMSPRSVEEILKKVAKKINLGKRVHLHALRHSFATHLIENSYSISEVQSLLGHKSPETTQIYLHVTTKNFLSVKSPLDDLQLENECEKNVYENQNFKDRGTVKEENRNLSI
ncbi:MAG: tyrosine-type recombinase/integrase [Nanoarchaeota archaeon]|nr:tyrosine-type recombinase/integrase [Nanoarchaeota archaeon]